MGTLSGRSRSDALLLTLALLLGLGGCSSDPDEASTASASGSGPASVSGGASHSTTATSDASATGSASGSTATATTGVSQTGGTSSASGTATTGLPELPCDPGFMFAPSPAETGAALVASFTHAEPLAYVELTIEGPGQASTTWAGITTEDPWTWSWHVHNLSPGIYAATFSAGDPASEHGTCQFQAIDTGPPPDPPPDTTGGGECLCGEGDGCDHCPVVGACLDPPSPVGPQGPGMTWECLDNAGCDNGSCRIWCPFEPCDMEKHPQGCPNNTEACWVPPWIESYEEACELCCESAPQESCWDEDINVCRYPGECGLPFPY